jgi:hypothetical protein
MAQFQTWQHLAAQCLPTYLPHGHAYLASERMLAHDINCSMSRDAREARLCVAEEMAREAWNGLEDSVKPVMQSLQVGTDGRVCTAPQAYVLLPQSPTTVDDLPHSVTLNIVDL